MKKVGKLLMVLLFITALGLTSYPFVLSFLFDRQADTEIDQFTTAILPPEADDPDLSSIPSKEPETQESKVREYADLYSAMERYNERIWLSKQDGLDSILAYEEPAINVSEYLGIETIGYVSIPAMDVELPLYFGASKQNMSKGAVILGNTSCPIGGQNTNCVIAAHRGYKGIPYFREIEQLQVGDTVSITNPWETLDYAVTGWEVVPPDSIDHVLIQPGRDLLTLVTCHPYRVGTQRYLVYCERVPDAAVEPLSGETVPVQDPASSGKKPGIAHFTAPVDGSSQQDIDLESNAQVVGLVGVLVAGAWLIVSWYFRNKHSKDT